ncbi:MAG: hypothetical protein Kow00108_18360 [Calditrichia bacterium]
MKPDRLSTKILAIVIPVTFIILVFFAFFIDGGLKHAMMDFSKELLQEQLQSFKNRNIENYSDFHHPEGIGHYFNEHYEHFNVKCIGYYDSSDRLQLMDDEWTWINLEFFDQQITEKPKEVKGLKNKESYLIVAYPIHGVKYLFVSSLGTVYHGLQELRLALFISIPIVIILIASIIMAIVGMVLAPVKKVIETARFITTQNLSRRLPEAGSNDEVSQLIRTMNEMIDRLEAGYTRMYHFAGNVAHELKTPLAILRGEIELALRNQTSMTSKHYQSLLKEIEYLNTMINRLLLLTRLENEMLELELYEMNLSQVLAEVVAMYRGLAEEKMLEFEILDSCKKTVFADPALIKELLGILLENSIKYSYPNGKIRITYQCSKTACHVSIEDHCKDKSKNLDLSVFNQFSRGKKSRNLKETGLGIGLFIANEIIKKHHGEIQYAGNPPHGCRFTFSIPLAIYEEY